MTYKRARELVLREGFTTEGGLIMTLRFGKDPDPARLAEVGEALDVIRRRLRAGSRLEGKLAYALFNLAFYVQGQFDARQSAGPPFRPGLDEAIVELVMQVELVFVEVAGDLGEYEPG